MIKLEKDPITLDAKKKFLNFQLFHFYPTALKGCQGIVFTHGVRMGGRASGRAARKSLSALYLRNRKV